jgi:hypothetical protein
MQKNKSNKNTVVGWMNKYKNNLTKTKSKSKSTLLEEKNC